MKLTIRLTKVSPTHHRFEYIRDDGARESAELETKSFLFHDLLHFAVESEAKLEKSFYGLLASGVSYAALIDKESPQDFGDEAMNTEKVIGPLTSVIKGVTTPVLFLEGLAQLFGAYGEKVPPWVTEEFVMNVQERMRRLLGHWEGTPFGKSMELAFEISD